MICVEYVVFFVPLHRQKTVRQFTVYYWHTFYYI